MKVFFLAAGQGTRIKGFKKSNKCLIKINNKSLINYHLDHLKKLKIDDINFITGHNSKNLIKNLKNRKIKFYYNKNYKKMNIASSIHTALTKTNDNTLISYTDVIYNYKIIQYFNNRKINKIVIPVLKNWKKVWYQRGVNIYDDAEELLTNKRKISKIGGKIRNINLIKYQFMGLMYIPKKILPYILNKFDNKKLLKMDTTKFINFLIKEGMEIKYKVYNDQWFEFDLLNDIENFQRYYDIYKFKN